MSRAHVANMHSISTPPSTPLSTPRAIPSPTQHRETPGHVTPFGSGLYVGDAERPRDSGVGAIGAFFATPYDSDMDMDSDAEEIPTPVDIRSGSGSPATAISHPHAHAHGQGQSRARAGRVSVAVNTPKGYKDVLSAKIRSQAGELYGNWSDGDEDDDDTVEYVNRPQPQHQQYAYTNVSQHALPNADSRSDTREQEQLQAPSPRKGRQSDESGRVRPLTVVEFPEPSLQPEQGHGRGYPQPANVGNTAPLNFGIGSGLGLTGTQPLKPAGPVRSHSDHPHNPTPATAHGAAQGYPRTPPRSNSNPTTPSFSVSYHSDPHGPNNTTHGRPQPRPQINTSSLSPPRTIALPPPSSPISPLLAAPPKPHFSPLSPPSSPFAQSASGGGARDSTNGSIRGFDVMAEKKALFREGQEELMSPFSTRRTERKRTGRQNTKSAMLLSGMGVDFWKRFSTHVKLDEAEKAQARSGDKSGSAWLNKAQHTRSKIQKMIWIFLGLLVCLAIALIVYFLLKPNDPPKAISNSL